jgi:hypothetical protein
VSRYAYGVNAAPPLDRAAAQLERAGAELTLVAKRLEITRDELDYAGFLGQWRHQLEDADEALRNLLALVTDRIRDPRP